MTIKYIKGGTQPSVPIKHNPQPVTVEDEILSKWQTEMHEAREATDSGMIEFLGIRDKLNEQRKRDERQKITRNKRNVY